MVAVCGVFGLLIGSFLNVVIWRVPRGESVVHPPSHCPSCDAVITARDNVPVVSWVVLRGRCRRCSAHISARYPFVELLTGGLFAALAMRFGSAASLPAFLYLAAVGVALAFIDYDTKRLPNVLTLPSYAVAFVLLGAAAAYDGTGAPFLRAAEGAAALFAFYLALVLVYPAGMGLGDVKLSGVLGAYLGWVGWGGLVVGAFSAFLVGGVTGIGLIMAGDAGRKTKIPFGPFMIAGALIGVFAGHQIASAYRDMTFG